MNHILSNKLEAFKVPMSKFKSVLRNEQNGFVPILGQINIWTNLLKYLVITVSKDSKNHKKKIPTLNLAEMKLKVGSITAIITKRSDPWENVEDNSDLIFFPWEK